MCGLDWKRANNVFIDQVLQYHNLTIKTNKTNLLILVYNGCNHTKKPKNKYNMGYCLPSFDDIAYLDD